MLSHYDLIGGDISSTMGVSEGISPDLQLVQLGKLNLKVEEMDDACAICIILYLVNSLLLKCTHLYSIVELLYNFEPFIFGKTLGKFDLQHKQRVTHL